MAEIEGITVDEPINIWIPTGITELNGKSVTLRLDGGLEQVRLNFTNALAANPEEGEH